MPILRHNMRCYSINRSPTREGQLAGTRSGRHLRSVGRNSLFISSGEPHFAYQADVTPFNTPHYMCLRYEPHYPRLEAHESRIDRISHGLSATLKASCFPAILSPPAFAKDHLHNARCTAEHGVRSPGQAPMFEDLQPVIEDGPNSG